MKHPSAVQVGALLRLGRIEEQEKLPKHVIDGIRRGQEQINKGLGKTSEEVFKKYGNL